MNDTLSIARKFEWLHKHGYMREVKGELALSAKALSLISKVPVERIADLTSGMPKDGAIRTIHLPEDMLRDMRRGSKELQARHNTTSMIEILYAEATK